MKNEILQYLNSFSDNDFHEINSFLKKFGTERDKLFEMRGSLTFLDDKKKIEVAGSTHYRLSLETPNIAEDKNVVADLDNWIIRAKITDLGREEIKEANKKKMESEKMWYDTANAKRQYEDYPLVKRRAKTAIIVSIISVLIALAALLIKSIWK